MDRVKDWVRAHPVWAGAIGLGVLVWLMVVIGASGSGSAPEAPSSEARYDRALPEDAPVAKGLVDLQNRTQQLASEIESVSGAMNRFIAAQADLAAGRDEAFARREARIAEREAQLESALQDALARERAAPPAPPAPAAPALGDVLIERRAPAEARLRILRPAQPPAPVVKAAPSPPPRWVRLPAGSFVAGRLLSGVYATARKNAAMPVLVAVRTAYTGPNRRRVPLEGCLAIGKASADLASERALIQLTTLSCVLPSGESVEREVKGYVMAEDGTLGAVGKVARHTGRWLANLAAATAIAAGEEVARTQAPAGPSTVLLGQGSSFSRSTARLVDFFLAKAEEVVPTIHVGAGTDVYLVMQEGVTIEGLHAQARVPRRPLGLD